MTGAQWTQYDQYVLRITHSVISHTYYIHSTDNYLADERCQGRAFKGSLNNYSDNNRVKLIIIKCISLIIILMRICDYKNRYVLI